MRETPIETLNRVGKEMMIDAIYEKVANKEKTFGHPVMIGDILDWLDSNANWLELEEGLKSRDLYNHHEDIIGLYNNYIGKHKKPIEEQTEDTIKYVFDLIKTN